MLAWKALVGRALIAVVFIIFGAIKIPAFDAMVQYATAFNVPFPEVAIVLSILIELGGGLMLLVGWKTKWAAKAIALFLIVVTAFFHLNLADQTQMTMFLKNMAMLGGVLVLIAHGPGMWALDNQKAPMPMA